jgi:hypothetical protein
MSHDAQEQRELSWDMGGTKQYPLCRGALTYMRKNGKQPRDREVNQIVQSITKEELDFVMSTPEFLEHHDLSKIQPNGKR